MMLRYSLGAPEAADRIDARRRRRPRRRPPHPRPRRRPRHPRGRRPDPRGAGGVAVPEVPGWEGRFFEDFAVGDVYVHRLGRTVLPVDNSWFTLLTQNTAPDPLRRPLRGRARSGAGRWSTRRSRSPSSPARASPTSPRTSSPTSAGTRCACPPPSSRATRSTPSPRCWRCARAARAPRSGIVRVRTTGSNQDGVVVITFTRTLMVYRRGHGPGGDRPRPRAGG